ncbi:MAG: biopolymer transporter ExbD [Lentisphaerales bacterium]|nr:biopolymer transporter ExbD [Lentisphaerales bacterium]
MKVKSNEKTKIPISAMIDVTFLLLIFFIVTSKEITNEAFVKVNLPGKGKVQPPPDDRKLTFDLYIYKDTYKISGQSYTLSKMKSFLSVYSESADDFQVNVKVSEDASHENLVNVLDVLNGAGLKNFGIYTLK